MRRVTPIPPPLSLYPYAQFRNYLLVSLLLLFACKDMNKPMFAKPCLSKSPATHKLLCVGIREEIYLYLEMDGKRFIYSDKCSPDGGEIKISDGLFSRQKCVLVRLAGGPDGPQRWEK